MKRSRVQRTRRHGGRNGIKQTDRTDARESCFECLRLSEQDPCRFSAISSRVPVAPEMLPNSLHLRPGLYSSGNALSPFQKLAGKGGKQLFLRCPRLQHGNSSTTVPISLSFFARFFDLDTPATSDFLWIKRGNEALPTRRGNAGKNPLGRWWCWKSRNQADARLDFYASASLPFTPFPTGEFRGSCRKLRPVAEATKHSFLTDVFRVFCIRDFKGFLYIEQKRREFTILLYFVLAEKCYRRIEHMWLLELLLWIIMLIWKI